MGTAVLDSGVPIREGLHVYAHSLCEVPGGVAMLVINNDRAAPELLTLPMASERYTLESTESRGRSVELNGTALMPREDGSVPRHTAVQTSPGVVTFAPATITFLALPAAGNPAST
jgi:hypothetical protein